jgi:hypothetical protein
MPHQQLLDYLGIEHRPAGRDAATLRIAVVKPRR